MISHDHACAYQRQTDFPIRKSFHNLKWWSSSYFFKLLKKLIIINMCNLYLHLLFSYFCMSTTIYKYPSENNFNLVYLSFNEDFWRISLKHFGNETNSPSSLKELQKKRMIVMKYISNCKFITLHTYIHIYTNIYVCVCVYMYVCSAINSVKTW